ncbi:MAG: hypothetical protein J7K40_02160 [candidate division Zixibacteria bacterium]|nr:hypothetical protein [candidate division Zixibacteria bacterium]
MKRVRIRRKKIKAIRVNSSFHWQPPLYIEVDSYCRNLEKDSPNEKIIAIFEATSFLVCTSDRGYNKGLPYFFGREDVRQVVPMD